MVENNFDRDAKVLMLMENKGAEELAEQLGISHQAIYQRSKGNVMSKGFVEMIEALGYDIKVEYIKRERK